MSETFIAVVGTEKIEFTLYTSIATRSSKFFQAAMSRDWKECREKRVTLAEVDVDVFQGYLQWLNTGDIPFARFEDSSTTTCAELYILGDFLDDVSFRNAVLDDLMNVVCAFHRVPSARLITLVWEQTPADCPLRKLILEIYAAGSTDKIVQHFANPVHDFPKAFVVDYLQDLVALRGASRPSLTTQQREKALEKFRRELVVA